jgi:nitrate reductase NapE
MQRVSTNQNIQAGAPRQLDMSKPGTRRSEVAAFLLLAVVAWPVLTLGVVGGYGFMVWMTQQIYGPPGAAHVR